MWRQWEASGTTAGIVMGFTDGTQNWSPGVNLGDQHGDQIGSSRLMTSDGGWPVWQGTFLPYGEEYNQQITTNHYKFTGKERDSESGLDYFGARHYESAAGRWISPDTINLTTARAL